jgi:hypothetical protein
MWKKKKKCLCRELFEKLYFPMSLNLYSTITYYGHHGEVSDICSINTGQKCYLHYCTWVPVWWQVADICAVARDVMHSLLLELCQSMSFIYRSHLEWMLCRNGIKSLNHDMKVFKPALKNSLIQPHILRRELSFIENSLVL